MEINWLSREIKLGGVTATADTPTEDHCPFVGASTPTPAVANIG
jgi:hypothetical protein